LSIEKVIAGSEVIEMYSHGFVKLVFTVAFSLSMMKGQSFEVVSIRPAPPYPAQGGVNTAVQGGPGTNDPTHIRWNFATLMNIIDAAFAVRPNQVTGPGYLTASTFSITATVPVGATREQVRAMWRNLLSQRFGMVARVEKKEFDGQELIVAKGGPKFQESKLVDTEQPQRPIFENGRLKSPGIAGVSQNVRGVQTNKVMANAQPMSAVLNMLISELNEPVVDRTELTGKYDFEFDYIPRATSGKAGRNAPPADAGLDIVEALDEYLGLRLRKAQVALDHVIIEQIDRNPTEN
jgi:uncharacterized protein (TIGR03435 family)